jgi:type I restriction enzyme S subunit
LRHRKDFIQIDDTERYKRCRVQLHAQGIALRDIVPGTDIKTKRQQVCRAGEFLVAEIDAKVGGFGLVPEELDAAIVSSHYFLFEIDESQLQRGFLGYYCRTRDFRGQVAAQGTTNYAAIRPGDVLGYAIPLPSLTEQQSIIARLDTLEEKARQVTKHLDAIESDAVRLLAVRFREAIANAPFRPLAEVAPVVKRPVAIDLERTYPEVGARSFGKGLFTKPAFDGAEATWQKPVWIEPGDLVFSNIKAWEGAIAVAGPAHANCIASHRYITCVPDRRLASADFLRYHFLTDEGMERIGSASPGTADRNRTLSMSNLMAIKVPVPSLENQQAFDALQAKITNLKAKHAAIREANAALMPATLERVFSGVTQ